MNNKRISFLRYYHGYTGGHQKVRDYLQHFIALGWEPSLFLSNKAATNQSLFSNVAGVNYQDQYDPTPFDYVFLAGMDWKHYLPFKRDSQTVINLIQHVRHGDPSEPLHQYLKEPAIRLCVSEAVKNAIEPYANGPCFAIKMGHRFHKVPRKKTHDIYILANKQPELGTKLHEWAQGLGYSVHSHTSTTEHRVVISSMASASVTILLPDKTEGFYLPGIEGMYYSNSAVVPYCVANAEYYNVMSNLYMPEYTYQAIQTATLQALNKSSALTFIQRKIGRLIAAKFTLKNERMQLNKCLQQLDKQRSDLCR